jgi:putative endonuclease
VNASQDLGRAGETKAADHYRNLGFKILDRNHTRPGGEIDLVVRRGRLLVFCEVKTRTSGRFGTPAEAVHPTKQARLRKLAAGWMREHHPGRVTVRFDVVSAMVRGDAIEIDHIENAF